MVQRAMPQSWDLYQPPRMPGCQDGKVYSPENQWLVQMYSLLKSSFFRGHVSFAGAVAWDSLI